VIARRRWDGSGQKRSLHVGNRISKLDESFLRGALCMEMIPGPIPSFPVDESVGLLRAEDRVVEATVSRGVSTS
jgi:hypothetical protein